MRFTHRDILGFENQNISIWIKVDLEALCVEKNCIKWFCTNHDPLCLRSDCLVLEGLKERMLRGTVWDLFNLFPMEVIHHRVCLLVLLVGDYYLTRWNQQSVKIRALKSSKLRHLSILSKVSFTM